MNEAPVLRFRARGHISAPALNQFAIPLPGQPTTFPTCRYPRRAPAMRAGGIRLLLEPRGGRRIQMAPDPIAGQAVVASPYRLKNPQVSMLYGDDVAPSRQRLPGAGPMPAEQLDDDPQEKLQQRIAGKLRQSHVEPEFLDSGRSHIDLSG